MEPGNIGFYSMLYFNIVINIVMIFFVLTFSSKDYSSKIKDVLLSKSLTSFEIIGGKYLGVIIPIIIINLVTVIISLLATLIFLDMPSRIENYLSYFLIINLPSILYLSAFNFFIVQLVKNRFAGILLSLSLPLCIKHCSIFNPEFKENIKLANSFPVSLIIFIFAEIFNSAFLFSKLTFIE